MKDWQVSYCLGNMFHAYVIEAENYFEALQKVLNRIPQTSQDIFNDLKVEECYSKWN